MVRRTPDRTSKRKPVVRASIIGLVGGVAALGAFGISAVAGGLVEATSFLLGIFIAAVTIGLSVAEIAGAWLDRPPKASRTWRRIGNLRTQQVSGMTCSSCGRPMRLLDSIRVCDTCDLAAVDT